MEEFFCLKVSRRDVGFVCQSSSRYRWIEKDGQQAFQKWKFFGHRWCAIDVILSLEGIDICDYSIDDLNEFFDFISLRLELDKTEVNLQNAMIYYYISIDAVKEGIKKFLVK